MILWATLTLVVAVVALRILMDGGEVHGAASERDRYPWKEAFVALLFGALVSSPLALALHLVQRGAMNR